jgi:hypothetical protein
MDVNRAHGITLDPIEAATSTRNRGGVKLDDGREIIAENMIDAPIPSGASVLILEASPKHMIVDFLSAPHLGPMSDFLETKDFESGPPRH